MSTLHVCVLEKFIPSFIEFVRENIGGPQFFLIAGDKIKFPYREGKDVKYVSGILRLFLSIYYMNKSEKVVLHSLFNFQIVVLLFFQPWLLKKCYWVIWGGDLYSYKFSKRTFKWKIREFFRRAVIKRMGFLVTGTPGDYRLTREWYGAEGLHVKCFNYPSNIYKDIVVPSRTDKNINIQVGNSGDPTNNHEVIFEKIESVFGETGFDIFCPISYGNEIYIKKIVAVGRQRFGKSFRPALELLPLDKYLNELANVDIAIFGHKRQQAFGNIITLLGLGKTVYMEPESTLFELFSSLGIKVYSIEELEMGVQPRNISENNILKVKTSFSKDSLVKSLKGWIV